MVSYASNFNMTPIPLRPWIELENSMLKEISQKKMVQTGIEWSLSYMGLKTKQ